MKPRASLGREMSRGGRFFRLHLHNIQGGHNLEGPVSVTVYKPNAKEPSGPQVAYLMAGDDIK